jgi:phosphatidylserine decarboxylase
MRVDRDGLPFIAAAVVPGLVLAAARRFGWAAPFLTLGSFFAFFFRDPDREAPLADGLVVSPADGRVLVAGPAVPGEAPPGSWLQVTIFLSPLDVHINRVPIRGRVTRIEYRAGRFLAAYRREAGENERNEIWIDHDGQPVVARQVVGVLARRIVCRIAQNEEVRTGQRFGLMRFGSRMDVFVPPDAELMVREGDRVRGGETVLAVLKS